MAVSNRDQIAPAIALDVPLADRAETGLSLPEGVQPYRIDWLNTLTIGTFHALALLALMPMFFNWTAVIVAVIAARLFGLIGINIGYHRLLTHRGFKCPKWLEHAFVVVAICCAEDTPARWVAIHRRHHEKSDEQPDPHSPLASFFWGHMGWLLVKNPDLSRLGIYERYAKDVLRDPFYVALERNLWQLKILLIQINVFFFAGLAGKLLWGGSWAEAVQFALSIVVWAVFMRTVLVWHQTWAVNSVTHIWGYRNYATDEDSRNNLFIGYLAHGEGWHNNHHADQRSARHGHRWWEFDTTYLTIRLLEKLSLVSDVVEPRHTTKR
ncbi:acyl-CoA desaturase [Tardiphaga sp. 768_D3_N2_1]|uniref:acyl-CoA desaturase n=1 Tax=Tardiphaga sp. 768_D3_N2_1 TaxID=3240783 RepID=UPI003F892B49